MNSFNSNRYIHTLDTNYQRKNIYDKVNLTIIKDKDGNILKKTRFKYDQFDLKDYGIDTEQKYEEVNLDPLKLGETYRGNLTTSITFIAKQNEGGETPVLWLIRILIQSTTLQSRSV